MVTYFKAMFEKVKRECRICIIDGNRQRQWFEFEDDEAENAGNIAEQIYMGEHCWMKKS